MAVKVRIGKHPIKDVWGLTLKFPPEDEPDRMEKFLKGTLKNFKNSGVLPPDAAVEDMFPITIEMPCCGKIHQITGPDRFPKENMPCCDYGYFVRVIQDQPRPQEGE